MIVDLAAGELLGAVPAPPQALSAAGHALTAEPPGGRRVWIHDAVPAGPLRWREPEACAGTCPEGPV